MISKKPPLFITIATALILVGGGALAYWGLQWHAARTRGLPAGIQAVPEDAIAVASFSTDSEQWQRLRQFGTPETQTAFDQQLARWRDRWLTNYALSLNQTIKPWVGSEVTLAWLPNPSEEGDIDSSAATLAGYQRIVLLPIADPEAAQTIAASLPATESAEAIDYRGITLNPYLSASGSRDEALWVGVLGTQLLLVAEDPAGARQAIDAYKGGKSLADVSGYRRSFDYVRAPQAFGRMYFSTPDLAEILAKTSQPPLPTTIISSFDNSEGIVATLAIASQGVHITSTSWLIAGSDRRYTPTNEAAQLPRYIPRDALVMASGGNFQQFWQDLRERRTWGAFTAFEPDNLALALQNSTGLILTDDLLPWMAGEFAVALVPPPSTAVENSTPLPNPGLIALVQVSDRPQAEQAFDTLDAVVKNRYRFTVQADSVGAVDLVKWLSPFQSTALARGWLQSNLAFLTVGIDTETTIVPKPKRSLVQAPLFQLTTGDAPSPNNGHFYLNLEALTQTSDNLFLPELPVENQGILRAMRGLGVTSTIVADDRLRHDLYVALKRGNRPGPLPSPSSSSESGRREEYSHRQLR